MNSNIMGFIDGTKIYTEMDVGSTMCVDMKTLKPGDMISNVTYKGNDLDKMVTLKEEDLVINQHYKGKVYEFNHSLTVTEDTILSIRVPAFDIYTNADNNDTVKLEGSLPKTKEEIPDFIKRIEKYCQDILDRCYKDSDERLEPHGEYTNKKYQWIPYIIDVAVKDLGPYLEYNKMVLSFLSEFMDIPNDGISYFGYSIDGVIDYTNQISNEILELTNIKDYDGLVHNIKLDSGSTTVRYNDKTYIVKTLERI